MVRLPCAYLRVYQPADEVAPDLVRAEAVARETEGRADTLRPHALGLVSPGERRDVYERSVEGETYVCPAHVWLRTLLGMADLERQVPDGATRLFFTEGDLSAVRRGLERIEQAASDVHPPLVQSPWHVPLRWFVCFEDAERRIEQDSAHLTIRYETTMAKARGRVEEALRVLKEGIVHPVMVGMVYDLKSWLDAFSERSLLELDYASISTLFEDEELADDHSAEDIWHAIYALAEGDGMRASLYYQRANERWTRSRGRGSWN